MAGTAASTRGCLGMPSVVTGMATAVPSNELPDCVIETLPTCRRVKGVARRGSRDDFALRWSGRALGRYQGRMGNGARARIEGRGDCKSRRPSRFTHCVTLPPRNPLANFACACGLRTVQFHRGTVQGVQVPAQLLPFLAYAWCGLAAATSDTCQSGPAAPGIPVRRTVSTLKSW